MLTRSMAFRCLILPVFIAVALLCFLEMNAVADQPNVILLLTDDQGYGDMSCHGNPFLTTPEIDRLYRDSVRLTDCHVDPTCSPTRAALMTGRYSSRVGVWLTYGSRHHLNREEVTMADVFHENGYRTAIFGKWHLGDNYPFRPHDRGFDESLIHGGGMIGETPDHWGNDYYDDVFLRNGVPEESEGYCTDVWFDEAIRFIDRNGKRPFFMYLSTNAPHGPLHVPEKYRQGFDDDPGVNHEREHFYGMIACIDENLGRLRQNLTDQELDRDTILIFMNDNGTGHGVTLKSNGKPNRSGWEDPADEQGGFNAGLRGRKGSAYEGGHRAACFIHWPAGGIQGGRDLDGVTAHLDILPTLMELCHLKQGRALPFDGVSLAKPLQNAENEIEPRTLFVHHQGRFGKPIGEALPIYGKDFCVMKDQWRLVGAELYDIRNDPSQRKNIASDYPEVQAKMRRQYETWWKDISRTFDHPNPFVIDPNRQKTVMISSQNWLGGHVAYSQHHVRNAMHLENCWTWIDVQSPGNYRITVRRWPREVDAPMTGSVSAHPIDPTRHDVHDRLILLPDKAVSVSQVRLKVGIIEQTVDVEDNAVEAIFELPLSAGLQKISGELIAADGTRNSAYYVYIESLEIE